MVKKISELTNKEKTHIILAVIVALVFTGLVYWFLGASNPISVISDIAIFVLVCYLLINPIFSKKPEIISKGN